MNRRVFLAALGAVATQQQLGGYRPLLDDDPLPDQPTITVTRYPYIQNVRNDRASILWTTLESGFGALRYSPDGISYKYVTTTSKFFSRLDTGLTFNYVQYQANLTGLTPNTEYEYTASVNSIDIAAPGTAR